MVSHLLNVDRALAQAVASGLGLDTLPEPALAARPTRRDLQPSEALSIVLNGPRRFAGRKLGVLVSDGADAAVLHALADSLAEEGARYEIIAPTVGGVELSDGEKLAAKHQLDGGPSVLFDAVALLVSVDGANGLAGSGRARDFVADAFGHCKFIGYAPGARLLLDKAGIEEPDEGCLPLAEAADAEGFVLACRALRHWAREPVVDPSAEAVLREDSPASPSPRS